MPISLQKYGIHRKSDNQSKICSIVPTGEKEMIKKFSKYLSDYFIKIGIVERKNKSWCQYVIEKKAIRLIFGMATLIFSLYIKKTLEIALFLIIFCSIRKHIGGWHASSPWKCLTLSSVMLLLITVFLEPSVERLPPIITLILNAVLFADILRCSPLYPQCVHFGENEKTQIIKRKRLSSIQFCFLI